MLKIVVPKSEQFNSNDNTFVYIDETVLSLEHSLVSISKWESKWHKPFISKEKKSTEETIDYIKCMTLTQNVNPNVYYAIPNDLIEKIGDYIDNPMTATKFYDQNGKQSNEIITSEVIYYWMVTLGIPFECQKWHLNRLLTLIRVCNEKNKPPKKLSKSELYARNIRLNAQRRKLLNSHG